MTLTNLVENWLREAERRELLPVDPCARLALRTFAKDVGIKYEVSLVKRPPVVIIINKLPTEIMA